MEVLPVPAATEVVSSFFGSIFSAISTSTGSSLLSYVLVTIMVFSIGFLLWTVGNWLYNLFTDLKENSKSEVKYFDANGQPIIVSVTA